MPRIQTYGAPTVGPVQTTNARFRAADNGGGVAGAIARGLQQIGGAVADYAQVQAQIEDGLAKTNAGDRQLTAHSSVSSIVADLKSKPGKLALDAIPDAEKSIDEALKGVLAQADPRTKRYLAPEIARLRASASNEIGLYAASQAKVYQQETGSAKLTNLMEGAIDSASPDERSQFIASARAQVAENARMAGLNDPDIIKAEERKAVSGIHLSIVDRYLTGEDVDLAKAYFDANEDGMTGKDRNAALQSLKSPLLARDTDYGVKEIMGASLPADGAGINYSDPLRGAGRGISSAFGVDRGGGKKHNGVDFPASPGTPIYATGAGKVLRSGYDDKSGNFVVIDHGNGTTSSYSHMQGASALKPGDMVTPDTRLGGVGSTGHSTGPHLHMVVKQNGKVVDPTKVIGQAQQSSTRIDLESKLAQADARTDWTPEKRERVKDGIRRLASVNDGLIARKEADADRAASEWAIRKGEAFTDISQMPLGIRSGLNPDALKGYISAAKSNATPKDVAANGARATELEIERINKPEAFMNRPLGRFAGEMTRAELQGFLIAQAKMKKGDPDAGIRAKVAATISTYDTPDLGFSDKDTGAVKRVRVQKLMESELIAATDGKRKPTEVELYQAFISATKEVIIPHKGFFGGVSDKKFRRYEIEVEDIPPNVRWQIEDAYKRKFGEKDVPPEVVAEAYQSMKVR